MKIYRQSPHAMREREFAEYRGHSHPVSEGFPLAIRFREITDTGYGAADFLVRFSADDLKHLKDLVRRAEDAQAEFDQRNKG